MHHGYSMSFVPTHPFQIEGSFPGSMERPDEVVLWVVRQSSWVPTMFPCSQATLVGLQVVPGVKQGTMLVGSFSEREKPSQGGGGCPYRAVLCGEHYIGDLRNSFVSYLILPLLSSSKGTDGQLEEGFPEKAPPPPGGLRQLILKSSALCGGGTSKLSVMALGWACSESITAGPKLVWNLL